MDGIEERSQAFLRKVEGSENGVVDVYVGSIFHYKSIEAFLV